MKNPLSHILICLILLSTSLVNAQTQSNSSDIYSDKSIIGKFITKVKERKEKKYEFYFSYYKPNFRTEEYSKWSAPTTDGNVYEDSIFYSIQRLNKVSDKVYGTLGISLGFNKIKNLSEQWNIKYGVGFTMFGFYRVPEREVIDEIQLAKLTVIQKPTETGGTIMSEKLNNEIKYETSDGYYFTLSQTGYVASCFTFPFSTEYKLSEKFKIGGDVVFTMPFFAVESKGYYSNSLKKRFENNVPTSKIRRFIPEVGLHIKYQISNYFYASCNSTTGLVINLIDGQRNGFNEFHGLSPLYYSYGLTLGINI